MIWIPIATLVVLSTFILVFKKYLKYTTGFFKFAVVAFFLASLFFIYWGPHLSKLNSGILEWGDIWYIPSVSVIAIIVTGSVLATKKSDKDQGL